MKILRMFLEKIFSAGSMAECSVAAAQQPVIEDQGTIATDVACSISAPAPLIQGDIVVEITDNAGRPIPGVIVEAKGIYEWEKLVKVGITGSDPLLPLRFTGTVGLIYMLKITKKGLYPQILFEIPKRESTVILTVVL